MHNGGCATKGSQRQVKKVETIIQEQRKYPGGQAEEVAGKGNKSHLHKLTGGVGPVSASDPWKGKRATLQWQNLTATTSAAWPPRASAVSGEGSDTVH